MNVYQKVRCFPYSLDLPTIYLGPKARTEIVELELSLFGLIEMIKMDVRLSFLIISYLNFVF